MAQTFNAKTQKGKGATKAERGWSRAHSAYDCQVRSGLSAVLSVIHPMRPGTGGAPWLAYWPPRALELQGVGF